MKKVSFYFFIILIITSCNSVKRVAEKEQLLKSTAIIVDGKKNRDLELNDFVIQRPNSKILGLPISVYFYNLGNPNSPKTPKEWGNKNPKKYNFFKKLFSEKQSIGVANSYMNFNKWFLKNGESPVIIDDFKTKRTVRSLNTYYKTIGFWKNTVVATKDSLKNKKGAITYRVTKNEPLFLDSIKTNIPSSTLKAIYQRDTLNYLLNKIC